MIVLVIHPEDELQGDPWAARKWDRVIDLGRAGAKSYARAEDRFGCPVTTLAEFREDFKEMRRVRELLAWGLGRLEDEFGLDWWELTAIIFHQQMEIAYLMLQFAVSLGSQDEVHVSRPCLHADVLRPTLGSRLHLFSPQADRRGLRHYLKVAKKFPLPQLLEILWDKTDSGYQIRGSFSRKENKSPGEVVLCPSSYINVSRTAAAYSATVPDVRFLLMLTRRSGWMENLPPNVTPTWLRRYASLRSPSRKRELSDLLERWNRLQKELEGVPEFQMLTGLGWFNDYPERFARGLEIRDAWRNVFDSEPVRAVICADDTNSHTRMPLLLAKKKGVPAIACHHGALDGRYMFKRHHADVLLAKGRMEEDYLVRVCEIPSQSVEVGAPALSANVKNQTDHGQRSHIVFFSEAYEVGGGRGRDFYQDLLPPLAQLALAQQKELVIKLHPSESLSERGKLIEQILNAEQRKITRTVTGALQSELLDQAWFGVTVMSTVVVECALQGVPCFLCAWLESWPYGYDAQFARFDLGIRLNGPEEIRGIPAILQTYRAGADVRENCWQPIDANRFRRLLGIDRENSLAG